MNTYYCPLCKEPSEVVRTTVINTGINIETYCELCDLDVSMIYYDDGLPTRLEVSD